VKRDKNTILNSVEGLEVNHVKMYII